MLKVWHISLKKTKIIKLMAAFAGLILATLTLTASSIPNLKDEAKIVDKQTQELIAAKNNRYLQNKEQPQIKVVTVKRLNSLTPSNLGHVKRTAFIVVGVKGEKKNVQIYSSKDLHGAFTADSRMNIIRVAAKELRSSNMAVFNRGLRFVFRACATKIDQQYQYSLDKYDLTNEEQNKVSHPNRVALPIALAIAILVAALVWFLRRFSNKRDRFDDHTK